MRSPLPPPLPWFEFRQTPSVFFEIRCSPLATMRRQLYIDLNFGMRINKKTTLLYIFPERGLRLLIIHVPYTHIRMPCSHRSRAQWADDIRLLPMLACAAGGPLAAPHKAALPLPVPRGSFVELGAYDGLSNSNTFMLERCFAWRGLLIEASPSNYKKCCPSRATAPPTKCTRPCAPRLEAWSRSRREGDQMGGEVTLIPEAAMRRFKERLKLASSVAIVPCAPLGELMGRAGLHQGSDFLSLDVEGAEAKVLQTVDPARFKVVLVETNVVGGTEKNREVHRLLSSAGLVRIERLGNHVNHAYVRQDVLARCGHAANQTCSRIKRDYDMPPMDCLKYHNFKDLVVPHGR